MPVVKRSQTIFGGEPFVQQVYCDSNGNFTIQLPKPVWESYGKRMVTGRTLEVVEKEFANAVALYHASKTTFNKVLLYEFQANCFILSAADRGKILNMDANASEEESGLEGSCLHKLNDMSFCCGTGLSLRVGVYQETVRVNPNGTTQYSYQGLPSVLLPPGIQQGSEIGFCPRGGVQAHNRLEWTENRERFFARLALALEELIVNLIDLTDKPEQLALRADAGDLRIGSSTN